MTRTERIFGFNKKMPLVTQHVS